MLIRTAADTPIQPKDIAIPNHMFDTFGHMETETSGSWLVQFAQDRGNWEPFQYEDIQAFYKKKWPNGNYSFNRLLGGPRTYYNMALGANEHYNDQVFIVKEDETYFFTTEFVGLVYGKFPATAGVS